MTGRAPNTQERLVEERRRRYAAEAPLLMTAAERVIRWLAREAQDPARIGRRVMVINYVLGQARGERPKRKELARRLNVTEARVSAVIAEVEEFLTDLRTLTPEDSQPL